MSTYKIKSGDTLGTIAKRTGTSIAELARLNNISDVNKIRAGDSLITEAQEAFNSPLTVPVFTPPAARDQDTKLPIGGMFYRPASDPEAMADSGASFGMLGDAFSTVVNAFGSGFGGGGRTSENVGGSLRDTETSMPRVPTAAKAYMEAMLGRGNIRDESFFNQEELGRLTDIARNKIRSGGSGISYSDYDADAGKYVGYGMDTPDLGDVNKNLKFTVGKGDLVREGDRVIAADEYDFDSPSGIGQQGLLDRLSFIAGRTKDYITEADLNNDGRADQSLYGLAHSLGEAFGPNAGEGPSLRASLGTAESLGLTQDQFNALPTLQSYEDRNRSRIKQRGMASINRNNLPIFLGGMR